MRRILIVAALLTAAGTATAQQVVKTEPPAGALAQGSYVFVDNGVCPKGQLQKVAAGAFSGQGRNARGAAVPRTKTCENHP